MDLSQPGNPIPGFTDCFVPVGIQSLVPTGRNVEQKHGGKKTAQVQMEPPKRSHEISTWDSMAPSRHKSGMVGISEIRTRLLFIPSRSTLGHDRRSCLAR